MSKIVNLTPHTINIFNNDGIEVQSFESMGIARAESSEQVIDEVNGIPVVRMSYGHQLTYLPLLTMYYTSLAC